MTFDSVNRPSHYTEGRKYETIDVIEDWELGFRLGNAVKYLSRAGRKDSSRTVQDLQKAIWYVEREIKALKGSQGPLRVTYEDILEDQAAAAEAGEELLLEYGLGEAEPVPFEATDADWEDFWNDWDLDPTPTSINLKPRVQELATPEEIQEILSRKNLDHFEDDEIVSTVERRGIILGFKKDGSSCVLNNGRCV